MSDLHGLGALSLGGSVRELETLIILHVSTLDLIKYLQSLTLTTLKLFKHALFKTSCAKLVKFSDKFINKRK